MHASKLRWSQECFARCCRGSWVRGPCSPGCSGAKSLRAFSSSRATVGAAPCRTRAPVPAGACSGRTSARPACARSCYPRDGAQLDDLVLNVGQWVHLWGAEGARSFRADSRGSRRAQPDGPAASLGPPYGVFPLLTHSTRSLPSPACLGICPRSPCGGALAASAR